MDGQIDRQTDSRREQQSLPPSLPPTDRARKSRGKAPRKFHLFARLHSVSYICLLLLLLRNLCRHREDSFPKTVSPRPSKVHGPPPFLFGAERPNSPQKNLSEMSSAKYRPRLPRSLARPPYRAAAGDFARVPSFHLSRRRRGSCDHLRRFTHACRSSLLSIQCHELGADRFGECGKTERVPGLLLTSDG